MNFKRYLEGPELKLPSLNDENELRPITLDTLPQQPPKQQWNVTLASATPLAFNTAVTPKPQPSQRRWVTNDDSSNSDTQR